ncbi:hypothetical protein P2J10_12155, partial [Mannheimia haemolytica]|nr:hypothetical protein [Mannheimia haemolytica]
MNNKRIKPEQFADFITQRTGRNLTCPICNSQEHYLHDGYDTFTELCGEKIIGVPTIPYRIEPSPDEVMKFANSQISYQETEEVNLYARLRQVEGDVREIKSNYLTKEAFYKAGGSTLIALVVTAGIALWTVYSHLDTKVEARFSKIDDKFVQVETNIKNLDIRLTKVESR